MPSPCRLDACEKNTTISRGRRGGGGACKSIRRALLLEHCVPPVLIVSPHALRFHFDEFLQLPRRRLHPTHAVTRRPRAPQRIAYARTHTHNRKAMVKVYSHYVAEYKQARASSPFSSAGWWLNRWPPLAHLETALKLGAFYAAYRVTRPSIPLLHTVALLAWPQLHTRACMILQACASLLAVAIADRLFYREIVSMLFIAPNVWSHWRVWQALRVGMANRAAYLWFCALMLAGEVVKLAFLQAFEFKTGTVARRALTAMVLLFAAAYAALIGLEVYAKRASMVLKHV